MTGLVNEIRDYIVENFHFGQGDDLANDDSFLEKGFLDSTGVLVLVDHLEETYGIKVGDDEITPENLDSITLISSYVQRKLDEAKAE